MNLWNLKYSKQRLAILQRTQAQKRHLISLIKAKSVISSTNDSFLRQSNISSSKISRKQSNSPKNLQIIRNNTILVKKLGNIEKLKNQRSQCKFVNISKNLIQNHQTIYSLNKNLRQKQIDQQNSKLFTRLIKTTATIKRNDWIKNNIQRMKYKQNINKSKYVRPDYSIQACKQLKNEKSPQKIRLKNIKSIQNKITSRPFTQNISLRAYKELR